MSVRELQEYTYYSRYARFNKEESRRETWGEAVDRVMNMHLKKYPQVKEEIEFVRPLVKEKRVLGSQRALQFGGTPILNKNARLYNCSASYCDRVRFFQEALWMLLCGAGVGFSAQKHHVAKLPEIQFKEAQENVWGKPTIRKFVVPDSIEGWSDAMGVLMACYIPHAEFPDWLGCKVEFDFSKIRPAGSYLSSGVGKAPGAEPLKKSLEKVRELLDVCVARGQKRLRSIDAYDIVMHASDAVLSGGVRRSATLCLFSLDDEEMMTAKTGNWFYDNPQRARSNNSALLLRNETTKEDFNRLMTYVKEFGEPGFFWAEDKEALFNPCFHRDTRLLTVNGYYRIEDLYKSGKPVDLVTDNRIGKKDNIDLIKYGVQTRSATPVALTQKMAKIFEVETTHGHIIRATANHEFPTINGRKKLKDLFVGDKILLQSAEGSWGDFGTFNQGLLLGLIVGDGTFAKDNGLYTEAFIDIWKYDYDQLDFIKNIVNSEVFNIPSISNGGRQHGYLNWQNQSDSKKRIGGRRLFRFLKEVLNIDNPLKSKDCVPECVWRGSRDFVRGYLQGLIFTDGSVQMSGRAKKSTISVRINQSNKKLLQEIMVLIGNFGIVGALHSRRRAGNRLLPDGKGGHKLYWCKENFDLIFSRPNAIKLLNAEFLFGVKCTQLQTLLEICGVNCRKQERYFTKIKRVEFSGQYDDVFCLTQPDTNTVIANGCVVGQCGEIGLYGYDETGQSGWPVCNLCEINGKKIKSKDDFILAVRGAAILGTIQAGYTDFEYLGEASEKIIRREALLGVSITGMMDSPDIIFDAEIQKEMAKLIVKTNEKMAEKLGINPAARVTCVKPAGCQNIDTMISTNNGILMLGEIGNINGHIWQEHSLEVLTDCGEKRSTKFFINGYAKTKKIKLLTGMELECTPNHKYKVLRNSSLEWVRADEITKGDIIPYIVGGYDSHNFAILDDLKNFHFNSNWNKSPKFLNSDLCWFLGLYTGDGSNHLKGIRIHGNSNFPQDIYRAKQIVLEQFGLESSIELDNRGGNRLTLVVNSTDIVRWLETNGLKKEKSNKISIPLKIRCSQSHLIEAFIDGYWCADGGLHPVNKTRNWVTVSIVMAKQIMSTMRALGHDCSMRNMPPTSSSKGKRMRYWIQEKKGRNGNYNKSPLCKEYKKLDDSGLCHYTPDIVVSIEDSECFTADIEVPGDNAYWSNSYISHNTTSCILGSSSGIHPHHAKRYFRRVQGNALEPVLQHFKKVNYSAVEKSVWSANNTDEVITFCIEIQDGKTKNQVPALELLEMVKLTQQNWVNYGKIKERCAQHWLTHNVSNTINIRPDEWDSVEDYIFKNRKWFAGISLIPQSGDLDYQQAPFVCIHNPREILQMYGDGALLASGLIVDGLHAFGDNLWIACDAALGLGIPLVEPKKPGNGNISIDDYRQWELDRAMWTSKLDWVRRVKQFSDRYCDRDVKKCTYLMKEVSNWKRWLDLNREYKSVDYSTLIETEDMTTPMQTIACSGGKCDII